LSASNNESDEEEKVFQQIKALVAQITRNTVDLDQFELVKDNKDEIVKDVNSEPFSNVPLNKIPVNSKIKIRLKIRDKRTKRDITIIAATHTTNGTLHHTRTIEISEFDTLPHETTTPKKQVKHETMEMIIDYATRIVQILISIYNALVNAGLIS